MNSDRLIGLAYVCDRRNSGKGSKGERILFKIDWRIGSQLPYRLEPLHKYAEARRWAAHYMKLARKNPKMF